MQVEIDYKSECMAGQTVESLGSHIDEEANGSGMLRSGCLLPRACIRAFHVIDTHSSFSLITVIVMEWCLKSAMLMVSSACQNAGLCTC